MSTSANHSGGHDTIEPRDGYTSRGFGLYGTITDLSGHDVEVVQSSAAALDAVRIYFRDPKHAVYDELSGESISACIHLDETMAIQLRNALDNFLLHVTNP